MFNLHNCPANGIYGDNLYAQQAADVLPAYNYAQYADATRQNGNEGFCGCGAYPSTTAAYNCCPTGTHFNEALNRCVPDPVPPTVRCVCPEHMFYHAEIGSCIYDYIETGTAPNQTRTCPLGMSPVYATLNDSTTDIVGCVCNPIPVCPKGFRYEEKVNGCVKDLNCCKNACASQPVYKAPEPCTTPTPCIPTQTGVCPAGYVYVASLGACVLESFVTNHLRK